MEIDFFNDPEKQNDYFSLVRELKTPGSTSTMGKTLTLYTARPVEDREMYQQAADSGSPWLPAGVFLSNHADHVAGIAVDFGKNRDIWRVKIDSNKVIVTNDTPGVKYYQIVGKGNVPVKGLWLV